MIEEIFLISKILILKFLSTQKLIFKVIDIFQFHSVLAKLLLKEITKISPPYKNIYLNKEEIAKFY